ncbi:P-loop containing nucleoside triphosphate hydrolase protein [Trametes maxima]|nr:P-loop containing nucleoside triphosphate hydrolase protein [Trametes maxima]
MATAASRTHGTFWYHSSGGGGGRWSPSNHSLRVDTHLQRAARTANVHNFVESLPRGYDTRVGENAALISGRQGQWLQIARPACILVLDECRSVLDAANQVVVMKTLWRTRVGCTTLVVMHKLPTMRMCDRVVVVEQGTYEQLMERRGVFCAAHE